jgi:hypothetical protein
MTREGGKKKKKKRAERKAGYTHFPVITGRHSRHRAQVLGLHPLMLSGLADATELALHGGATTNGFGVFVEAVQRTVHAARWGDGRGLLRTFGGPEGRGDIQGALERTQLAGLQGQLVQSSGGETG